MINRLTLVFLLVMLMALGCRSLFLSANEIQDDISRIESQLQPQIEQLTQFKNSINVQGRALRSEEITFVKKVESIETRFAEWQATKATTADRARQQNQLRKALLNIQQEAEAALQQAQQLRD